MFLPWPKGLVMYIGMLGVEGERWWKALQISSRTSNLSQKGWDWSGLQISTSVELQDLLPQWKLVQMACSPISILLLELWNTNSISKSNSITTTFCISIAYMYPEPKADNLYRDTLLEKRHKAGNLQSAKQFLQGKIPFTFTGPQYDSINHGLKPRGS